ncbi:MAG: tyrosine-type recombinase/integrase [Desulfofustis sp. PB-SRB1]|nr:tyrosine-type recombinase/integrase [Desulfofustis sp. PB-SRB1]
MSWCSSPFMTLISKIRFCISEKARATGSGWFLSVKMQPRICKNILKTSGPRYARKNKQQRRLFLTDQGRPVTGNSIRTSLFHYKKAAGITKTASPHSFRRSCATHLLQQGADIRYVQKLLGHRHIRTTQIYTRVYPIDLKKTHTRTHPGL